VSADPLSPERGSYGFAQNMLRQVAYDTLSRRDRKARHLTVAGYLRAAFPGDGEEVTDVIARHYLDALAAVPDDPDVGQIRGQAVNALVRAAERAERTGAPVLAAASYASAAELSTAGTADEEEAASGLRSTGTLWERAADAALTGGNWATAIQYAGRAREQYLGSGQARAAARAQATAGTALQESGRHTEAREQLTAAMEVLRDDPDADTVGVLAALATLEVFAGSPDADRLSAEGFTLAQALGVGGRQLGELFVIRGIYHGTAGRSAQAVGYFREGARLAGQIGDNLNLGRALICLSDCLTVTDPAAGAETAREAAEHARRAGARRPLAFAITNLTQALVMLGDWDTAEQEFTQAIDADGLADHDLLVCYRGWLAALRGDAATAQAMLARLVQLRASETPQDRAMVSIVEAFTAAAGRQPETALRCARAVLGHVDALGVSADDLRWAWPLAVRTALDLGDTAATRDLLTLLDSSPPGPLAPLLRAERDLVAARLAASAGDPGAATMFAAAIDGLRELSTPYHLAHGLLDHAGYLLRLGDTGAAALAVAEARDIADRLRCRPLLDRAGDLMPAERTARA
jgi:tetratricopeptide (TPR) repeat protein